MTQSPIIIKIKKLHEDAIIPTKTHPTDSGWDLYALEDTMFYPMETKLIKTGIAIELPPGYDAQIRSRSSMAYRRHFIVTNGPGTVDNSFINDLGEILTWIPKIFLPMYKGCGEVEVYGTQVPSPTAIKKGERIAQLIISEVINSSFIVVAELSSTDRGLAGLGSSGK